MSPETFMVHLRTLPLDEIAAWFTAHPGLTEILDRRSDVPRDPIYISEHEDSLIVAEPGYGRAGKPEDYLRAFAEFVNTRGNDIPALVTVVTRPRDLTRQQLRTLLLELDRAGFNETALATAWRQTTNREIAARIIGYIRQAALGDPLLPFSERVDHALQTILASRQWTNPQREWLKKLAAQTRANLLVDRQAIEQDYVFTQVGGFARANKLFDGQLPQILSQFNDSIWQHPA